MTLPIKPVESMKPASHSCAYTRLDAFYSRYLQGVNLRKLGAVLVPLQGAMAGVLLVLHIPADKATYISIAVAVVLGIAYLAIPKDAQGLMLNLMEEASADPAKAERIAGAIANAGSAGQALRDGIAAATSVSTTAASEPPAPPAATETVDRTEASDGNPGQ